MKKSLIVLGLMASLACNCFCLELNVSPSKLSEVDANITLYNKGVLVGEILRGTRLEIKTLTFQNTNAQEVLDIEEKMIIGGEEIKPSYTYDELGNKYAVFKARDISSKEFVYYVSARIKRNAFLYRMQDDNISDLAGLAESKEGKFLKESKHIESNDPTIRTLSGVVSDKNTVLGITSDVLEWVHSYVSYDPEYYGLLNSALQTYAEGKGTCDEFSNLAAALLRAKGIPAKYMVSVVYDGRDFGMHAFIEVFFPSRGWIPVDATFFEAGMVDAGHFVLAEFLDQEQAKDVITTAANLSIEVEKSTEVKVNSFKVFEPLFYKEELNPSPRVSGAQEFLLGLKVLNSSNSAVMIPFELVTHNDFIVLGENARMVFLEPGQEKEVEWVVTAPKGKEGLVIKYDYRITSFDEDLEGKISVIGLLEGETGARLSLKEIRPFVEGEEAFVIVEALNLGFVEGELFVNIDGNVSSFMVPPGGSFSDKFRIKGKGKSLLRITGEGLDYSKEIEVIEEEAVVRESVPDSLPGQAKSPVREEDLQLMVVAGGVIIGVVLIALILLVALRKRGF